MIDPQIAYSLAGKLVLLGWAGLLLSLFVAAIRPVVRAATQFIIPSLLAVAYGLLIWRGFAEAPAGGFGSIAEIRALFQSDSALVAGWLHYLAFDLFIGSWIVAEGLKRRIPALLVLPCLPLTFLFGPTGLLLFILIRLAFRRRQSEEAL